MVNNRTIYDNGLKQTDRIAGLIAVAVYAVLLLILLLFVDFSIKREVTPPPQSNGVLINFGNETLGGGKIVTKESVAKSETPKEEQQPVANTPKANLAEQTVANDNAEDAMIAAKAEVKKPKQEVVPTPKEEPKKPVVNSAGLYKKRSSGTTTNGAEDRSHGAAEGREGKSGSKDGQEGVAGSGGEGKNFSLSGRSLIGSLASPIYNERVEGTIIVEIQVNREGNVIAATYKPQNSTISSRAIIDAARAAALKAKFNADPKAAFTQIGTITYILKVE